MPTPTDRGYVTVTDESDGTYTIEVFADMAGGQPVGAFATHSMEPSLVIDPEVVMVGGDRRSRSQDVVQVFADDQGTVHVMPVVPA